MGFSMMLNAKQNYLGTSIRQVKEHCLSEMQLLLKQAKKNLESNGFQVQVAESVSQVREYIASVLHRNAPVLLAGTSIDKELGLYGFLTSLGHHMIDAGPANRALRILNLQPRHPIFPLFGYRKQEIYDKLKSYYGNKDLSITDWQEEHYKLLAGAGTGITGCTALAVQEGVILISEEKENIHIASLLPPVHIVVVGMEKLVHTIEEALLVARGVAYYGARKPVCRNLFFISGPSATADIQGVIVRGMHGPREVHVILLDNGRTAALDKAERDLLMCIECGCCLKSCRVYQNKGPVFSETRKPPFYSWWALAKGGYDGDCLQCGECARACPLNINIAKLQKEGD